MAEFAEVMKQWSRMCEKHICDNRDENGDILPLCPLVTQHNGYPCDDAVTDLSHESVAQVEEIVMAWAAENPEPVYPTFREWLISIGVIGRMSTHSVIADKLLMTHIPAEIAEKLGIEPKEG